MRKIYSVMAAFFCCVLLMGAATPPAPVLPTKGFYVNDYAPVLFDKHRDELFKLSTQLYEETGIQVVVLTVSSLSDLDIDTYAQSIMNRWPVGGAGGKTGVLILVSTGEREARIAVGEGLPYLVKYQSSVIEVGGNNVSKAIMNVYRPMLQDIYQYLGIAPDAETQSMLENPQVESTPFGVGTIVFLMVIVVVMGRSLRVSRKYRKRFLKGYVRPHKTYARTYNEEDEYNNEKLYKIDYDGMD